MVAQVTVALIYLGGHMLLKDIISSINKLVSNNSSFKLDYDRLKLYLDGAIDYVNTELLTEYPTIEEYFYNNIGYYSVILNEGITPVLVSNKPMCNNYVFDEYQSMLLYNNLPVGANSPEYIFVKESSKFYKLLPDYSYYEQSYDMLEFMPLEYDYNDIPDRYIRSCVIYKAASLYLEEEDELESQYQTYRSKADKELAKWKQQYYSMYKCAW